MDFDLLVEKILYIISRAIRRLVQHKHGNRFVALSRLRTVNTRLDKLPNSCCTKDFAMTILNADGVKTLIAS